jgi:hypothetical protein
LAFCSFSTCVAPRACGVCMRMHTCVSHVRRGVNTATNQSCQPEAHRHDSATVKPAGDQSGCQHANTRCAPSSAAAAVAPSLQHQTLAHADLALLLSVLARVPPPPPAPILVCVNTTAAAAATAAASRAHCAVCCARCSQHAPQLPPLVHTRARTFFTIFCSSIRNARTMRSRTTAWLRCPPYALCVCVPGGRGQQQGAVLLCTRCRQPRPNCQCHTGHTTAGAVVAAAARTC